VAATPGQMVSIMGQERPPFSAGQWNALRSCEPSELKRGVGRGLAQSN
jgi:hypothetical protein